MAHRYHIKMAIASLLQFGWSLDWHRPTSLMSYTIVQAAYSIVMPATSQIWSCNVRLHMLRLRFDLAMCIFTCCVSDLILQCASSHVDFHGPTVQLFNEFYFALSTFQVSGKKVLSALLWIGSMVVTHILDWVLTRSLWGTFSLSFRIFPWDGANYVGLWRSYFLFGLLNFLCLSVFESFENSSEMRIAFKLSWPLPHFSIEFDSTPLYW